MKKIQLLMLSLLLAGCASPYASLSHGKTSAFQAKGGEGVFPATAPVRPITFLSYQAVNNNLQGSLPADLETFEQMDSAKYNLIVEADTLNLAFTHQTGFQNVGHKNKNLGYRFFVTSDPAAGIHSPYRELDDPNTGDGAHLQEFVSWGFNAYPGKLRVLDIRSHGHGPLGIADDFKAKSTIAIPAVQAAISKGLKNEKLDVLTTKACLMATIEVGIELSPSVRFLVASENGMMTQPGKDSLLYRSLPKMPASAREFAVSFVQEGMKLQGDRRTVSTLSALDLEKSRALLSPLKELRSALLLLPQRKEEIKQLVASARNWGRAQTQTDLYDLADKLERLNDPLTTQACRKVKAALEACVMLSITDEPNRAGAHGLTILTQLNTGDAAIDQARFLEYQKTAFDREVGWSRLLEILGFSGPERKNNVG